MNLLAARRIESGETKAPERKASLMFMVLPICPGRSGIELRYRRLPVRYKAAAHCLRLEGLDPEASSFNRIQV